MDHQFRKEAPKRTCSKKRADYHNYKSVLADDFNHKCGYTDCSERWFGGKRTFQIDHLKPQKKYPHLINAYSNLVYCCSYVNRAKSDDDSPNYLDPCNVDYNEHFKRDDKGFIIGKTEQGKYMVSHMHLNLFRYAIIWNLDRLRDRILKLKSLPKLTDELDALKNKMLEEYFDYSEYLAGNQ